MKKFRTFKSLAIIFVMAFNFNSNSQTSFDTTIISTDGYDVDIQVQLLDVVAPQTCSWGYNFNVEVGYNISFNGNNLPSNLFTLQGEIINCGGASSIFFDLPNAGGQGSLVTTSNPW